MNSTAVLTSNPRPGPARRFWPELMLLAGLILVVVATALGAFIDSRNTAGSTEAAVVVVVAAVAAVWCVATFLVGRLHKIMRGKAGEGFVMLVAVTVTALGGLPVSLIVGWAIMLSIAPDTF